MDYEALKMNILASQTGALQKEIDKLETKNKLLIMENESLKSENEANLKELNYSKGINMSNVPKQM